MAVLLQFNQADELTLEALAHDTDIKPDALAQVVAGLAKFRLFKLDGISDSQLDEAQIPPDTLVQIAKDFRKYYQSKFLSYSMIALRCL